MEAQPQVRLSASLYVGDLPVDLTHPEDVLFNLFNRIGMVISIKVCRDITTQRSLGYAYVNFQNPSDAEHAIESLNCTDITPNHPIRVMWSTRDPSLRKAGNNNLFVKNLDPAVSTRQLRDTFAVFGSILSCKIATDAQGKSRGYGFVHFEREEVAKQALSLNGVTIGAQAITVTPFKKKSERDAEAEKTFVVVYAKNIKPEASEESVQAEFAQIGPVSDVFLSTLSQHPTKYALVTMKSHEAAQECITRLNGTAPPSLTDGEQPLFVARALKRTERNKAVGQSQGLYQNQGRNVYVKHLDDDMTKDKLHELFSPFGSITSCVLMHDPAGNFRGFGFVCFEEKESASAAIRELNGKVISRKPLYVSQAQQRDMRLRVLEDNRRAMLEQHRQRAMQMSLFPHWRPFPPPPHIPQHVIPPQFVPPFVANSVQAVQQQQQVSAALRRPPMQQRPPQPQGIMPRMQRPLFQQGGVMPAPPPPQQHMLPMMQQQQRPYTQPPPPQQRQSNSGINAQQLAKMSQEDQKNALGERLYAKIHDLNPSQAAKITGMLLEMETAEILNVLEDQRTLIAKVNEAVAVLQQHEAQSH